MTFQISHVLKSYFEILNVCLCMCSHFKRSQSASTGSTGMFYVHMSVHNTWPYLQNTHSQTNDKYIQKSALHTVMMHMDTLHYKCMLTDNITRVHTSHRLTYRIVQNFGRVNFWLVARYAICRERIQHNWFVSYCIHGHV